jgi:hypothetical protein
MNQGSRANRCSIAVRPGISTPSRIPAITLSSSASSQSKRDDHSTYVRSLRVTGRAVIVDV